MTNAEYLYRCMAVKQKIVSEALTPRKEFTVNTDNLIASVEQWGKDRQIIPNSTPMAQLLKTMSELGELADATLKADSQGIVDGVGDVVVTLILYCKLSGITLPLCLAAAYDEIKDRKGTLTKEGVFVKEVPDAN
jgi:NTP pyrophosphatase (non-canonical NTP hydrolase)